MNDRTKARAVPSGTRIRAYLERNGWTRETAGAADFDAAVGAVCAAVSAGLGIIASGPFGVGKTHLVRILAAGFGHHRLIDLSEPSGTEMLTDRWQDLWGEDLNAENVVLDDLGAELPANEFGVRIERAADFLAARHRRFMSAETFPRLFVTTNLTSAELDARYGGRVLSRLKDLCVPLRLGGRDKREWTRPAATGEVARGT